MIYWFRTKLSELFLALAVVVLPKGGRHAATLAACLELYLTLQSQGYGTLEVEQ